MYAFHILIPVFLLKGPPPLFHFHQENNLLAIEWPFLPTTLLWLYSLQHSPVLTSLSPPFRKQFFVTAALRGCVSEWVFLFVKVVKAEEQNNTYVHGLDLPYKLPVWLPTSSCRNEKLFSKRGGKRG